jgi:hypothetical protein
VKKHQEEEIYPWKTTLSYKALINVVLTELSIHGK